MSFKRIILNNGLRIITVEQPDSLSATVLVMVEAGSKYENKKNNGLSHFLEHMCFKGTEKRPTAMAISSELDGLGADYNAFTSQEYTGYYAKVRSELLPQAVDLVADLYSNPVFNEKEIEKEKGVIIEELNMYEDLPMRKVAELFDELLYGDQPAGWPVGGRKEIIRRLRRKDFLSYRQNHYVTQATSVIVIGSFNWNQIIKQLKEVFAKVPATKKFGKIKTKELQKKPQVLLHYKKSDQTHLIIGCRAFSVFDDRRFALEVLSDILGGGMSSRLFQRIREELGAAYYVRASNSFYSDHGYLTVSVGVEHSKLEIVIETILKEMKCLVDKLVSEDELRRAKDHLSGHLVLGLESSDSQAMFYGGQEILRQLINKPNEVINKIRNITAADIQAAAKYVFKDKNLNLSLIGPFKDEKNILKKLKY